MPKTTSLKWTDLRVGVVVIAGIGVLIMLILAVSGDLSIFSTRAKVYTDLPGAEGLKNGDEVRIAGVKAGIVKKVTFSTEMPADMNATSSVRVEMSIDGEEALGRIRTDSRAVLRQLGLLGGQYVNISPGTLQGDPVRDGDTIKGLQETTIGQVVESSDDLLKGFKTLSDKLNQITETIDKGEGSIGKFIHDDAFYVNLNKVMLEAQTLVSKIRDGDGTAGRLINDPKLYNDLEASIASIQTTLAKVEKGEGTVGKLVHDQEIYDRINKAAARLDTVSERLDKVTAQIESGKGTVGKLIYDDSLHNDFTSAVASLKSISERLDRGEGTAGKLLHDDQLYNNLNALSSESVKLLYDFRQNPKKYLSVKVALF
ncbi:MAG: MlaD family protein [Blastocatellia bacterium]